LVALPWVTLSQWLREESGKISGHLAFQLEETAAVMDTYDHAYGPAPTLLCAPSLAGEVRDIQFIVSWAHEYVYQIPGITVSPLRGGDDQGLCYGFKIMLSRGHDPADVLEFWFGLWFLTEHSESCVFLGGYGPSREWLASKHMGGRPLRSGYWVVPFPLYGAWTEIKERLGTWLSDLLSYVAG